MKANELRIGNFVKDGIDIVNVTSHMISLVDSQRVEFDPIPLTEEWLLRFGIKLREKEMLGIWNNGDAIYFSYGFEKDLKIQYVHQLQNLYSALTGEELELKS
jgi:hypothetical protein